MKKKKGNVILEIKDLVVTKDNIKQCIKINEIEKDVNDMVKRNKKEWKMEFFQARNYKRNILKQDINDYLKTLSKEDRITLEELFNYMDLYDKGKIHENIFLSFLGATIELLFASNTDVIYFYILFVSVGTFLVFNGIMEANKIFKIKKIRKLINKKGI